MNAHVKTEQEMQAAAKPYEFRELAPDDVFLMATIISKIGINQFAESFDREPVKKLIAKLTGGKKGEKLKKEDLNELMSVVGVSVGLDMVNVLLANLEKVKKEIYQLLSQTSNLSVEEIRALKIPVFIGMIKDFIKKDEFADFFKGASSLFK